MNEENTALIIKFFRWFCHPEFAEDIEGDLLERFDKRTHNHSQFYAKWHLIKDVLLLFRPGIIRPFEGTQKLNYYGMIKHDLLIGWRSLKRDKGYSALNIASLAIGMTVSILVGLWIFDELSFNRYHQSYDQIAQVHRSQLRRGAIQTSNQLPTGLGTLLGAEYRNHFKHVAMIRTRMASKVLSYKGELFTENGYFMQPEAAHLLTLEMVKGDIDGLSERQSIFLSESLATKIFGDENPVGELISLDASVEVLVAGVYKNLPGNSSFRGASYFAPLDLYLYGWSNLNVWDNYNMHLFVQMHPNTDIVQASQAIEKAMDAHVDPSADFKLFLVPMSDWRLFAEFENGVQVFSERLKFVWFYGIIGVIILLLACINFVNLSTARAGRRIKEIGVRKSLGARKARLRVQFLLESFLITSFAVLLSLLLTYLLLPVFNELSGKELQHFWTNTWFWPAIALFAVFTALLAGGYPAFYLSAFKPVASLKGLRNTANSRSFSRKALVVFQFTISITLIIGTLLVREQINHARDRPAGYEQERLLTMQVRSPQYAGKYHVLRDEMLKTGVVEEFATSGYAVTSTLGSNNGFTWEGKAEDHNPHFNTILVSPEYGKAVGWELVAGRDFERALKTDMAGMILNESAVKEMGLENPVGAVVTVTEDWLEHQQITVLGVVKDMVKGSPFQKVAPSMIFPSSWDLSWLLIKLRRGVPLREAIGMTEEAFEQVITTEPFNFDFVDEVYAAKFREEEQTGKTAGMLAIIAILISCLGLLGLATYVAELKTKEIGIRKVLGASVLQLWKMLSFEFIGLVAISCLLAIPISWYMLQNWLIQFAYKTDLNLGTFILAIVIALTATLLTVSLKTLGAASANPVEALKDE